MAARPSPEPAIRPYRAEDLSAVVGMLADRDPWRRLGYTAEDWRRLLAPPLHQREGWMIERDGAAAGIAVLRPRFLVGDYLELLAIAPGAEGMGLGGALLAGVERIVFARTRNLFVCVSDFNDGAQRFYARNGYHEIGRIADLLVSGSAELLMRKTTGPARGS